jgi:hypothetical protein
VKEIEEREGVKGLGDTDIEKEKEKEKEKGMEKELTTENWLT